ncbi:MAG: hypothetical protein O9327_07155 [Polaromonas sp.]|nr:hypothetical protein [Polaromonas sp.]
MFGIRKKNAERRASLGFIDILRDQSIINDLRVSLHSIDASCLKFALTIVQHCRVHPCQKLQSALYHFVSDGPPGFLLAFDTNNTPRKKPMDIENARIAASINAHLSSINRKLQMKTAKMNDPVNFA